MADPEPSSSRLPFIWPHNSNLINSMFAPSASPQPGAITALASTNAMAPPLEFNEIRVTDPSSQANGILSARIDTRIKLCMTFRPGSPVHFLKIPKTPSVHGECPGLERSLKFSVELKGAGRQTIIRDVCERCKERRDQSTWDMVDFRATTTSVPIENGTANIEFFIKCYAHHHGITNFCADAILRDYQDNVVDRRPLPLLFNISGKGKQPTKPKKAQRRAVRGVSAQQHSIIPAVLPSVNPSVRTPQYGDNDTVQEWMASHVGIPAGDRQTSNSDQQPFWVDTTTVNLAAADPLWYTPSTPSNAPPLMTNAVQPPQLGFSPHNIGSIHHVDSLPLESNSNPVVNPGTRTIASTHGEQIPPVMFGENILVPRSLEPTSGEPHRRREISQASRVPEATSRMLSQSSSGIFRPLNTSSAVPSGQGASPPGVSIPPETPRLQIESATHTRNEGINQITGETVLYEVDPERGPTTGGIRIALFGGHFPAVPLYVGFGDNWVRARRHDARVLRCRLPPSDRPGVVNVILSQTPSRNAPEVGWSTANFEYEDSRTETLLSMLETICQRVAEPTPETRPVQPFATSTHRNPNLNTGITHSTNQEREEIPPRLEEVDLEDISIRFLCTYSTLPNWKQIVSSRNDHGQTMAHICVTLGYFRLLQHLFTWQIDVNIMDDMGSTALHYAYLFKQEECAGLLIRSGADPFILDDLGRSPSDLNPSLEVRLHPVMEISGDSSTRSTSTADYIIEMPEEAEGRRAKHFLVQQWARRTKDERRSETHEVPPSGYRRQDVRGQPDAASTASIDHPANERVGRVMDRQSFSSTIQFPQVVPTLLAPQGMEDPADIAFPVGVGASAQARRDSLGYTESQGYRSLSGSTVGSYHYEGGSHSVTTLSTTVPSILDHLLKPGPQNMTSTPKSDLSLLCSNDPLDEYLSMRGTGLSDPAHSSVIKRRRLLGLVKRLRSAGGTVELGLPQIVVVGSQSVGKSALIENISGITVPRDTGTCTRCPIECHMTSSSSPWQAVVSIRRIVDSTGKRVDWPKLAPFGPPITDPADVEMRIRQAQQALLNPDMPMEMFLSLRGMLMLKPSALRFTRNSIVVEIKGQGVDDLAFVDLPGVIASIGSDGHESDIADVEELVSEFIKDPHCLILLVISCETDPENQKGRHLVRQFDRLGERTIAVLTKPDRIEFGDEGKWLDILRNRTEIFKGGWFCTRQPGLMVRLAGVTPENARADERDFFETTRPWSNAEPDLRARLGTMALSKALSQKLFEVIAKRLPEVEKDLHRNLKDVRVALGALQYKGQGDAVYEVHFLLRQFHIRIHDAVNGTLGDPLRMGQADNKTYHQFVEDIGCMTPRFRPWPQGSGAQRPFSEYPDKLRPREVDEEKLQSHIVYLDEIVKRLENAVTSELPGNWPQVELDIVREYIDGWLKPSEDIVYRTCSNLRTQLSEIVHGTFMKYTPGGLHALVGSIVDECLDQVRDTCFDRVREAFDREKSITTTFQIRQFEAYKVLYEEHYTAMYQRHVESDDFLWTMSDAVEMKMDKLVPLPHKTPPLVKNRREYWRIMQGRNHPVDGVSKAALKVMAGVRSHYDLAMQRYTDTVSMILDQSLILALKEALPQALTARLPISGPNAEDECRALLQPSEDVVAKWKALQTRRALLEAARRELKSILMVSV